MGRLVARTASLPRARLRDRYERALMAALTMRATRGRHANVLQHMVGYFSDELDKASRQKVERLIEEYRSGAAPLDAPMTLVADYVRRFKVEYLERQAYVALSAVKLVLMKPD